MQTTRLFVFALFSLSFCALLGVSVGRHLTDSSLGKDEIYNEGLSTALPLGTVLPKQSFTIVTPGDDSSCNKKQCDKAGGTLSAAKVTYCDQESPVAICVCSGAPHDTGSLASAFSQVPFYLRSSVKAVTVVYADTGYSYTNDQSITIGTKSPVDADVLTHESAHAQDDGYSSSSTWSQAISEDTCVPDADANIAAYEDYAQMNVAWIYQHATGSLPSPGPDCMNNQLVALSQRSANGMQEFQSKADQRDLNSLLCHS